MAKACSHGLSVFCLSLYFFLSLLCLAMSRKNITTDESSLLAFKSSISDPYHVLSNWSSSISSSSSSLCNWVGVTCDLPHTRVKALNLSYKGLLGTISPHLGNLSFLAQLDLGTNSFYGQLPQELFRLRRLRLLDLRYNNLSGTIPPSISNLSSLQVISLAYNNNISGEIPRGMGDLAQLRTMDLQNNQLSGKIPWAIFQGLPKLRELYLSQNGISGKIPDDIGNLTMLQKLYLDRNNLEGEIPISLFNISSLREVDLDFNNLNGSLQNKMCHQLPRLQVLTIYDNQLEGSIPTSIGNCTSLKWLSFGVNLMTGTIPMEIGNLDQLEAIAMGYNKLSGPIPSNLFNISKLTYLYLGSNSLSGTLPLDLGYGLPNLQQLHLFGNKLTGNFPNGLSNASMLTKIDMIENEFSGTIPNIFGDLTALNYLQIGGNNLIIDTSHNEINFFTSFTRCRQLRVLGIQGKTLMTTASLPKSIGNLSETLEIFRVEACGLIGNIPPEIGNISNLLFLSFAGNNISGLIPSTIKGLQKLQSLDLGYNGLQGSIVNELCEIGRLSELKLRNNKLSGVMPECLGNMTSLRELDLGSNRLNFKIPSSFWNLKDILKVDLSSNALDGELPPEIGTMRALILLDLSINEISSNIPETISFLKTLQYLGLSNNKLKGPIPKSLAEMVSLSSLNLSHNLLSGTIPKSLESLVNLKYVNLSYNRLQGEIPNGGPFVNFTALSFMHNEALCGNPRFQVPPCSEQVIRKRSRTKLLLIKCILPIVVSIIILVVICITVQQRKRRIVRNPLGRNESNLGAPKRVSYYELVQATNGFSESNLLGRGSFGSVYQGILSNGLMVAIKVLHLDLEGTSKSFDAECNAMRNLRHRNLTKIISSCSNLDFKSLVMEFMPNGSIDKWLYSHDYCLDFLQRLSIITDVASALEYLHHGFSIPVIHCDLKPSNVLLDEDMVAHVSDFGMAKLLDEGQSKTHTETLATLGYIAPEYGSKGIVSTKGDVYSYGIMVMEIFTRKKPTDDMFAEGLSLKNWISESMPNSIMEIVDSNLVQRHGEQIDDILPHISSILRLALSCCSDSPEERIEITDVSTSLIKIKILFTQMITSQ